MRIPRKLKKKYKKIWEKRLGYNPIFVRSSICKENGVWEVLTKRYKHEKS